MNKNSPLENTENFSQLQTYFEQNFEQLIDSIIKICEIPAPTFSEDNRGQYVLNCLQNNQNLKIHIDSFKNVIVRYIGKENKAKIAILAHLDTVFPLLDIKVVRTTTSLEAPGIGDNSASVGTMLQIIRAWIETGYQPDFDVLFVANSCEEGLGDLKGVKGLLDEYCRQPENNVDLHALLSIDGTLERVTHIGIGVKRLKITVKTTGGHSWANFGRDSAIHIIGNVISEISKINVPDVPKTTFNVGLINGGTSVNTIAQSATCIIDLRSMDMKELLKLEETVRNIINNKTNKKDIDIEIEVVGDRPVGKIDENHPLVIIAKKSGKDIGLEKVPESGAASTDANIPLSRGIPAIAIGCYKGEGAHTTSEKIFIDSLQRGIKFTNLVILRSLKWISDKEN
jgi:acetylornithine deacetylase/succinyl-diaminopimelate desuccinylase-like protein